MNRFFTTNPTHTARAEQLRQQIQGYLREPSAAAVPAAQPLFDACVLWDVHSASPIASCGNASASLVAFLEQKTRKRELPKPRQNATVFFESDTGCVFLSHELWERTGLLFAMSLPIASSAAAAAYRAFAKGQTVHVLGAQSSEKVTDGEQIMRLAALFDLIFATRDRLLPNALRAEALAAIFGLTSEQFSAKEIPPLSETGALVALIRSLMEASQNKIKGSELYEKV